MRAPSCTNNSDAPDPCRIGAYAAPVSALKSTFEPVVSSELARMEDSPGRELAARYTNWRPPGRNCGNACAISARESSSEVTGVAGPPATEIWYRMPAGRGQNRMTPAGLQA